MSTTYVHIDGRYMRFVIDSNSEKGWEAKPITDAENDLITLQFSRFYTQAKQKHDAIEWRMQDERSTQVTPALLMNIVGKEENVAIRDYGRQVVAYWGGQTYWCPAIDWDNYLREV